MLRIKIRNIILRDKSTRSGVIISCTEIVEIGFGVVIVAAVTDRVNVTNLVFSFVYNRILAPGIRDLTGVKCACNIIDMRDIAKDVCDN